MYRSFVNSINSNGRVHELGMMLMYYLRTNLLAAVKLLPLALSLLLHDRMPLKPHRVKGRKELKQILQKFASVRGLE